MQGKEHDEQLLRALLLWAGMLQDSALLDDVWRRVQALEGKLNPFTLGQYTISVVWYAAWQFCGCAWGGLVMVG